MAATEGRSVSDILLVAVIMLLFLVGLAYALAIP